MKTARMPSAAVQGPSSATEASAQAEAFSGKALDDLAAAAKAQFTSVLEASNTWLKGVQSLREMQRDTALNLQKLNQSLAEELESVRDVNGVLALHARFAQSYFDAGMHYWSSWINAVYRSRSEALGTPAAHLLQAQTSVWGAWQRWFDTAWRGLPGSLVSVGKTVPAAAVPPVWSEWNGSLAWPAQEAAQEAMALATTAWNEWLTQAGRWQHSFDGAKGSDAAPSMH